MTQPKRLTEKELLRIKGKKNPGKFVEDLRWMRQPAELTRDIDKLLSHIAALEEEIERLRPMTDEEIKMSKEHFRRSLEGFRL